MAAACARRRRPAPPRCPASGCRPGAVGHRTAPDGGVGDAWRTSPRRRRRRSARRRGRRAGRAASQASSGRAASAAPSGSGSAVAARRAPAPGCASHARPARHRQQPVGERQPAAAGPRRGTSRRSRAGRSAEPKSPAAQRNWRGWWPRGRRAATSRPATAARRRARPAPRRAPARGSRRCAPACADSSRTPTTSVGRDCRPRRRTWCAPAPAASTASAGARRHRSAAATDPAGSR